ncbi:MAG: hypothetical protein V4819_13980 [Verrucomicrobiota bacterium]
MIDPFTRTRFLSEYQLETWYPEGVLDGAMAICMVKFLGFMELTAVLPFHRFADLSGLTGVHLDFIEIMDLAATRRAAYHDGPPVKSAILAPGQPAYAVARTFATLMELSAIDVQVFRTAGDAATWLGVPVESLSAEA